MPARSIASLTISFGLVSIPVKLYTATESSAAIRFKLMGRGGVRLRQQYVADDASPPAVDIPEAPAPRVEALVRQGGAALQDRVAESMQRSATPIAEPPTEPLAAATVERSEMVKGYEFEPGRFVTFTADELQALADASRQTIDIVAFMPDHAVDPLYYDKPYFLVPDRRGAKPYSLLLEAMRRSGRCALGKWAWRSKEHVVQIRPVDGGMVLQQLLYADEVRPIDDLPIELAAVGEAELKLAMQLIDGIAVDRYDPGQFVDEEKQRILAAVEQKIAGERVVVPHTEPGTGGNVLDLMAALRASLKSQQATPSPVEEAVTAPARKPARRAPLAVEPAAAPRRTRTKPG